MTGAPLLDLDQLARAPVAVAPFPYFVAQSALSPGALEAVTGDFPAIAKPGLFPLPALQFGPAFGELIDEIRGGDLEAVMERKFDIDLRGRPLMITVRGQCQRRDGRIHNDSKDKLVTCLLYLNAPWWPERGGRLRLLGNRHDLNSVIAEVPPEGGAFVAFKRTDDSWHGHAPYEGPRRYIMFNWLKSNAAMTVNTGRHTLSSMFKTLGGAHAT
jgi:hypothetical protein